MSELSQRLIGLIRDQKREQQEQQERATRHNEGKIDYTLLPLDALKEEALVWTAGMQKYGRTNWEKLWGEDTPRVVGASALRHLFAYLGGEEYDPETGLHHLAHLRCNCAMGIRYSNEKRKEGTHDRSSNSDRR